MPASSVGPLQESTPLEVLVADYLTSCRTRGLSVRTLENAYGFALDRVFLPWCRRERVQTVEDLSQATLDRFTSDLLAHDSPRGQPLSKASVHSYVRPVRQLLHWAEARGEVAGGRPQLPKQPKRTRGVLSRAEIERLEVAARSERDKVIVRLFSDCGLRLAELTGLGTGDISHTGNRTYLRVRGKGDRERLVPMLPDLGRRLERLARDRPSDAPGDRIFFSRRRRHREVHEPLTESGVAQIVGVLGTEARLGGPVHPHLLRHSWITHMLRRGMNPIQLAAIAGASEKLIAEHYAHLSHEDAYDALVKALVERPQ